MKLEDLEKNYKLHETRGSKVKIDITGNWKNLE